MMGRRRAGGPFTANELVALRVLQRKGSVRLIPGIEVAVLTDGLTRLERRGVAACERTPIAETYTLAPVADPPPKPKPRLRVLKGGAGRSSSKAEHAARAVHESGFRSNSEKGAVC